MRSCRRLILAVILLVWLAPGQEPPSLVTLNTATLHSVSPPPIALTPDPSGTVPPEQIRALLIQAEQKDLGNDKRLRDYTYIERQEEHKLDAQGNVAKTEIRTSDILEVYGEQVEKLIAKDDQPLPADEVKKEDEKIQKIIDKRKNESEDDRRKQREEDRKFVLEVADAFNFRLVGSEMMDGRDTWVLEGEPRPGYEPKHRDARMLNKLHGRVWIDKAEAQWVKLDITALDTIAFGVFLARIHKGARIVVDLTKVNEEVWLPRHVQFRLDVRLALVKNYREDIDQTFRDYKKFRADSKITVLGEANRE